MKEIIGHLKDLGKYIEKNLKYCQNRIIIQISLGKSNWVNILRESLVGEKT